MTRYTPDEVAAQTAAVAALVSEGRSHRWIADKLGISTATVHERRRSAAELDERRDITRANLIRQEATQGVRTWLTRVEDGYADEAIGLEAAAKLAGKLWDYVVRWNGAALPFRVSIETDEHEPTAVERYRELDMRLTGLRVQLEDLDGINGDGLGRPNDGAGLSAAIAQEVQGIREEIASVEQHQRMIYDGLSHQDQAEIQVGRALMQRRMERLARERAEVVTPGG